MIEDKNLRVRVGYLRSRLIYLHFPPKLYDDLAMLADNNERTMKAEIEALVREAVDRHKEADHEEVICQGDQTA